jgi:GGDEF domain-containing protein
MNEQQKMMKRIERMERELSIDSLTGAHNRHFFFTKLDLNRFKGGRLYFVDLDDFKKQNDSKGHIYGDQLLCRFAKDLRAGLKAGDLLIRYAGDEFIIVARQELHLCSKMAFSQGSIKIRGLDKRGLLEKADLAMYRHKARRKSVIREGLGR